VQVQAIEAKSGTVLGATSVRGTMAEIFAFEDALASAVVGLLTPLRADSSGKTQAVRRDVPASDRAFELFLRGLEIARTLAKMPEARLRFEQALGEDPVFAPAWAHIGRCHHVIGKYIEDYAGNDRKAEDAFRRALALSPELPVAHRFYTHWESEHGRADAAVARLLQHVKANRNDAHLFAALVYACRYAGLMGASWAAHQEARRLDPTIPTSAEFTLLLLGDAERLKAMKTGAEFEGIDAYLRMYQGRLAEVRATVEHVKVDHLRPLYRFVIEEFSGSDPDPARLLAVMDEAGPLGVYRDPEAVFLMVLVITVLGVQDRAMTLVDEAIAAGFTPVHALENAPVLAALRGRPQFQAVLDRARQRQKIALAIFERGDGPALLGIPASRAT
jgi:tetratricopeptide (TPR) repeat protein